MTMRKKQIKRERSKYLSKSRLSLIRPIRFVCSGSYGLSFGNGFEPFTGPDGIRLILILKEYNGSCITSCDGARTGCERLQNEWRGLRAERMKQQKAGHARSTNESTLLCLIPRKFFSRNLWFHLHTLRNTHEFTIVLRNEAMFIVMSLKLMTTLGEVEFDKIPEHTRRPTTEQIIHDGCANIPL